jgi:tRNA-splicing ligase RtcB
MKTLILTGQEILQLGYPQGKVIGVIIRIVSENYTAEQKEYVLNFLRGILKYPERFSENKVFREVVDILLKQNVEIKRRGTRAPYIEFIYEGKPLVEAD